RPARAARAPRARGVGQPRHRIRAQGRSERGPRCVEAREEGRRAVRAARRLDRVQRTDLPMTRWLAVLCVVLGLGVTAVRADTVTVGLFAPTAPFPSTSARVELATRLGEAVGKALGTSGSGKVFARGADFASAVRKGEV